MPTVTHCSSFKQVRNANYSTNILLTAVKLAKITRSVPQSLLQGLLHELGRLVATPTKFGHANPQNVTLNKIFGNILVNYAYIIPIFALNREEIMFMSSSMTLTFVSKRMVTPRPPYYLAPQAI